MKREKYQHRIINFNHSSMIERFGVSFINKNSYHTVVRIDQVFTNLFRKNKTSINYFETPEKAIEDYTNNYILDKEREFEINNKYQIIVINSNMGYFEKKRINKYNKKIIEDNKRITENEINNIKENKIIHYNFINPISYIIDLPYVENNDNVYLVSMGEYKGETELFTFKLNNINHILERDNYVQAFGVFEDHEGKKVSFKTSIENKECFIYIKKYGFLFFNKKMALNFYKNALKEKANFYLNKIKNINS